MKTGARGHMPGEMSIRRVKRAVDWACAPVGAAVWALTRLRGGTHTARWYGVEGLPIGRAPCFSVRVSAPADGMSRQVFVKRPR